MNIKMANPLFIFRIHRNLNFGMKNKAKHGKEHFFCFQITQTPLLEILIQTLTSLKNHYKQNSVKVQEVSYVQTK